MSESPQHDDRCHSDAPAMPPALFSIVIAVGVLLIWIGYMMRHRTAENKFSARQVERLTQSAINPNTADWASLVRIPCIGPARAQKLLAWRKSHRTSRLRIVFYSAADLRKVPTFGPKTIAEITPYLTFPRSGTNAVAPP